jgi:hypothetical protein
MQSRQISRRVDYGLRSYPTTGLRATIIAIARFCFLLVVSFSICRPCQSSGQVWVAQGPAPNRQGQVENIRDGEVVGAIRAIAPHPDVPNILYAGAVNGGIWKTTNAMTTSPKWKQQTDHKGSLSIGALEFDPTDDTHQTLVAGTGQFSSFGDGGGLIGLFRTVDGGAHWRVLDGEGVLRGLNISGVAPRGKIIVVVANNADEQAKVGVWRTNNGGKSWKHLSGDSMSGLPVGPSAGIASDPRDPKRLFVNAGWTGLYRSPDAGATWNKVSNPTMERLVRSSDNLKIAVGSRQNIYVAVDIKGALAGIFRSGDGGNNWVQMDLPSTSDGGIHPGKQGANLLSLSADPQDPFVVYVGGDRQPAKFVDGVESDPAKWPNSIGAWNFSGRLFRGDASKPSGTQWVHLTHSKNLGSKGGGTANSSAPHGDSRAMAFAADGTLIEADDGGIYRRTTPRSNEGAWYSMNGTLQTTEFLSVAWDSNSHVVVGGAQDTGTPAQYPRSSIPWQSISTSDGGVVALDAISFPGYSYRFSSAYSLNNFRRQVCDSKNVVQTDDYPQLTVLNGGSELQPQFYTPLKLNSVAPERLIIGAANSVYESLDRGDTVTEIGPGIVVNDTGANAIAYGSRDDPDTLYVGFGEAIYVRKGARSTPLSPSATYAGGHVVGIALNVANGIDAFVISPHGVFRTVDAGNSNWTEITGNLPSFSFGNLRSITYNADEYSGLLVVGTDVGVFAARGPSFSKWSRFGSSLPDAPVYQIEYNNTDKLYVAGTLGRGAWTLTAGKSSSTQPSLVDRPDPKGLPQQTSELHSNEIHFQESSASGKPLPAENENPSVFKLGSVAVVDVTRHRLYAMDVDGGTQAVDLSTGKKIWMNTSSSKPIGVVSDRVICQMGQGNNENDLNLIVLDSATGEKISSGAITLPQGIRASIHDTLKGHFAAVANKAPDGNALVNWVFIKRPLRGIAPHTRAILQESAKGVSVVDSTQPDRGTLRMDLATGTLSLVSSVGLKEQETGRQDALGFTVEPNKTLGQGFLSGDRRDILVAERTGSPTKAEPYILTIYDRISRARIGQIRSHFSVVPFFINDSEVIYESATYNQRTEQGFIEQPHRLVAIDLKTGSQVWSLQLGQTDYTGPFPP